MRFVGTAVFALLALQVAAAAGHPADPSADDEATRLAALARRATAELHDNILPFWIEHVKDPRGGFHGEIRADLSVNPRAPRGALMACRILWSFSAAARRDPRPEYRAMAQHAFDEVIQRFWDPENGGLYWTISPDGSPQAVHKQVYLQTFGIYALAEYHRATGNALALERAREIFRLLESRARDREHGGYLEAFSRDWSRELPEMRRNIGGTAPKSQNTHLHVMEAYTNLLRVWPHPALRAAQTTLVGLMLDRILDPQTHHLGLYFHADWKPASDAISFGHDIEAGWLLCEAADVLADEALRARTRAAAVAITRAVQAEAISPLGGVVNTGGPRGITDRQHEWWSQAEAVVGFLNAYAISRDPAFLRAAEVSWEFIERHVVDRAHGEWFLMVDEQGHPLPNRPKASLWKCCYHNSRACMEIADRATALSRP